MEINRTFPVHFAEFITAVPFKKKCLLLRLRTLLKQVVGAVSLSARKIYEIAKERAEIHIKSFIITFILSIVIRS